MRKLRLIKDNTSFDFIGRRFLFLGFSAFLILLSAGLMATLGINFGVDFRGGILIEARTTGPADIGELRDFGGDAAARGDVRAGRPRGGG